MHPLKTNLPLFLLLSLLALLPGCDGQKDHRLPQEAKEWIPYVPDQTDLEFVDDQNQIKKVSVYYREFKKEITPKFSFSSYFQDEVEASLNDRDQEGLALSLSLVAYRQEQKLVIGYLPDLGASYIVGSNSLDQRGMNDAFLDSYTSRGREYQQVIKLKCYADGCDGKMKEVYYAKSVSLIEFVQQDGKRWYKAN